MKALRLAASLLLGSALAMNCQAQEVGRSMKNDVSPPLREILRDLRPSDPTPGDARQIPNILKVPGLDWQPRMQGNGALTRYQSQPLNIPMPAIGNSFLGLRTGFGSGGVPPDTNADVSPTLIGQWINTSYAFFAKNSGVLVNPGGNPIPGNALFAGFGGPCQSTNDGDPIILWDDAAERWVMSQFVVAIPGSQCFAVSTSSDPFGTYNRYQFNHTSAFPDYPHIGIWTDDSNTQNSFLMVSHDFTALNPAVFAGASFWAFERDKMLAGQPAAFVRFGGQQTAFGAEPIHLNGKRPARGGTCPVFIHFNGNSEYQFWDLCLNWTAPATSVLSPPTLIPAGSPFVPSFDDVPQLGSTNPLDAFGTHVMYQASAYSFADNSPYSILLAINHHVKGPTEQGAIRWVQFALGAPTITLDFPNGPSGSGGFESEIRLAGNAPRRMTKSIVSEGTYAPDQQSRWMGSIAIDRSANMALGYTRSSATTNPKILVSGRLLTDPAGSLRDEVECTVGSTGSQLTNGGRWGDYSSMSLDPADDCTFWHANEYLPTTGNAYATRICSVRFPECGLPDYGVSVASAARIELCGTTAMTDPSYLVRVAPLNGFTGTAALSATGVPAGATAVFQNGGGMPVNTRLTLVNGRSLPSGEYSFQAVASSGAQSRSVPLSLGVSSAISGVPTLNNPAAAATGVLIRPMLEWTAVAGALRYTVQVASDVGFTNIVNAATVTGTSYTTNVSLLPNTAYFWRVRSENYCGLGAFSSGRTFTTGVPGQCPAGTSIVNVFSDDFQAGANGWTTAGTGAAGTSGWVQQAATAGTGLTTIVWTGRDNDNTSDFQLISPTINVPANAQVPLLLFDAFHSFEIDGPTGCWDGATVEVSTDNGANWTYLDDGRTLVDPYTGTISAGAPLAGRKAWCHIATPGPSARAIVNLAGFTGAIRLRFRTTSDSNTVATAPNGMHIDNLVVQRCQ